MMKLLLLPLLLLTACSLIVEKPKVDLADVRFAGLDGDGISIDFLLTVTNPNSFELPLHGYSYTARIMALPLAQGTSKDSIVFPGKTSTDILIPVQIRYSDVLQILKRRPGLDAVPYQLTANLDVGTPMGEICVPVRKSGTLALPEKYRPGVLLQKFGDLLK